MMLYLLMVPLSASCQALSWIQQVQLEKDLSFVPRSVWMLNQQDLYFSNFMNYFNALFFLMCTHQKQE